VQDDETQKALDIPGMDIVYTKALANIVALASVDANAGLPGVSEKLRKNQRTEVISILRGSSDLAYEEGANGRLETVCLTATPR
jgi:hypothetical protein